jgi:hypothetical protein
MRARFLMPLALLAVSSCDNNNPAPKGATVSCNCTTPSPASTIAPEPAPEPAVHHRGHVARRGATLGRAHSYRWHREYAEPAIVTYDYHSDSRSYYLGETSDHEVGEWHGHHLQAISDDETRARMQPWRGYDADCPDDKR